MNNIYFKINFLLKKLGLWTNFYSSQCSVSLQHKEIVINMINKYTCIWYIQKEVYHNIILAEKLPWSPKLFHFHTDKSKESLRWTYYYLHIITDCGIYRDNPYTSVFHKPGNHTLFPCECSVVLYGTGTFPLGLASGNSHDRWCSPPELDRH